MNGKVDPKPEETLSFKYRTIEDFMNDKESENLDIDLGVSHDMVELVFNKPIFDMAFIITHHSHILGITLIQKYFQSKYGFTTHCIYLQELSRIKHCIRDLKLHQVSYAVVLYENSLTNSVMDIYILYPVIELQKNMPLAEIDQLVKEDFDNLNNAVSTLKKTGEKYPHPRDNEEKFRMDDHIRYYFCLLSDNRMVDLGNLKKIKDYLEYRRSLMENTIAQNPDYLDESWGIGSATLTKHCKLLSVAELMPKLNSINLKNNRPLETCRQEDLKYYVYEPIAKPKSLSIVNKSQIIQENININHVQQANLSVVDLNKRNFIVPEPPDDNTISPSIAKTITVNARTPNLQKIKSVTANFAQISNSASNHNIFEKVFETEINKINDSHNVTYKFSGYYLNQNKSSGTKGGDSDENEIISLSSDSKRSSPPLDYDLFPITPPTPLDSPQRSGKNKRKIIETAPLSEHNEPLKKVQIIESSVIREQDRANNDSIKNCPESLVNLFRLILHMVPLTLPHDNVLHNILSVGCNEVQNGILVPSLKNVMIDYDSCKSNGVSEIISSIFGIYETTEQPVEHLEDMNYVWKKYFPDHLYNFSMLILFYRFVKLLILYKLFNSKSDCTNKVISVLQKVNVVVNFDFKLPIIIDLNRLNCFSESFDTWYKESNRLHEIYPTLSNVISLQPADKNKDLDRTIKQKKIEFVMGPILAYFVQSINSIHQQMSLAQMTKIYDAVRTLRFCFRKIFPIRSSTVDFISPKSTDPNIHRPDLFNKDIIDELKWMLEEFRNYQCVLFTKLHYEFINCIFDFSLTIEKVIDADSDSLKPKANFDSLITLDPVQFINAFSTFDCPIYQYHPDTEIEFFKISLKENWIHILQQAFKGEHESSLCWNGKRIIKEINILLPSLWSLKTFDEAVTEAAKLHYTEWTKIARNNPSGWYAEFVKNQFAGIVWLNMYHLPYTKAVEELQKYGNMLKNEFLVVA